MILLILLLQILPEKESMVYVTNDKGKIGTMDVTVLKDSLGYHVTYEWENRSLEVVFDSLDMSTVYVKKIVGNKVELEIVRENKFNVFFKGNNYTYKEGEPIYDRHAIEYAIRGFHLNRNFKKTIRFHVPEFMVVNANLKVVGEDTISSMTGNISCWKVEMSVKILFFSWKSFFWLEKEYPYRFAKFEDESQEHSISLSEYKNDL